MAVFDRRSVPFDRRSPDLLDALLMTFSFLEEG
jgi:hypothetical protein